MDKYLLIDGNNLAWKAFYTMGHLSHADVPTGVVYGFFSQLLRLHEIVRPTHVVFAFDNGESVRKDIYPPYKINRLKSLTEQEKKARKEFYIQVEKLQTEYLPNIGYKNILSTYGLEADDIIGSIVVNSSKSTDIVIASTDQDMYQLLSGRVSIFNGKKHYTMQAFKKEYGIKPSQWPLVKAMAGCKSDNIRGIEKIGEITACKYLRGELKEGSIPYNKIIAAKELIPFVLQLVTLPFEGTPEFDIEDDLISKKKWLYVAKTLGMDSIKSMIPREIR